MLLHLNEGNEYQTLFFMKIYKEFTSFNVFVLTSSALRVSIFWKYSAGDNKTS